MNKKVKKWQKSSFIGGSYKKIAPTWKG